MTVRIKYLISGLLLLSCGLLTVLVPGGFIETRNFSHIDPFLLGKFNTFLTSLVMLSILIIYYWQQINWFYILTAFCGVSYFLVYVLDLAGVFPVSPDPMSQTLFVVEVAGLIVSLPLIFLFVRELLIGDRLQKSTIKLYSKRFIYFALSLSIAGLGIIVFATKSAMEV